MGRKPTWHCASAHPNLMCRKCKRKYLAIRRREAAIRKRTESYRAELRKYNREYQRARRARLREDSAS